MTLKRSYHGQIFFPTSLGASEWASARVKWAMQSEQCNAKQANEWAVWANIYSTRLFLYHLTHCTVYWAVHLSARTTRSFTHLLCLLLISVSSVLSWYQLLSIAIIQIVGAIFRVERKCATYQMRRLRTMDINRNVVNNSLCSWVQLWSKECGENSKRDTKA